MVYCDSPHAEMLCSCFLSKLSYGQMDEGTSFQTIKNYYFNF